MSSTPDVQPITGTTPYLVTRSTPDEIVRHDISDDELGDLSQMSTDKFWEAMWTSIGAFIGTVPNTISALVNAYSGTLEKRVPLSGTDFVQTIICFCAFVVAVALWLVMRRARENVHEIVEKIRKRTRQPVR